MLSPEKIGFAILYLLSEVEDERTTSAEGLTELLEDQCTKDFVRAQLIRLNELGLVRDAAPLPVMINDYVSPSEEYWKVTHEGTIVIRDLARRKQTFVGKLASEGIEWLKKPAAKKARLSAKLDRSQVQKSVKNEDSNVEKTSGLERFFDISRGFYHTTLFIAALIAIALGYVTLSSLGIL